jgi:hypothetical protein
MATDIAARFWKQFFSVSACPGSGESVFFVLAMMRSPFFIMVIILAWDRGDVKDFFLIRVNLSKEKNVESQKVKICLDRPQKLPYTLRQSGAGRTIEYEHRRSYKASRKAWYNQH